MASTSTGAAPTGSCTLNAWTVVLAYNLRDPPFKVNAVNSGATATDLNGFRGKNTPAYAAQVLVRAATLPADGPSGQFFGHDGTEPW